MRSLFHSALSVARAKLREPRVWIALVFAVICGAGLGWGLPASDGWDNDGVAPRDFLPGLAETYTPGHYFTYPPLHLLLLAILTAPVSIYAALTSHAASTAELVATFTRVEYMTAFAVVARIVSLFMALGIILTAAKIAEELWDARSGTFAALVTALNMSVVYYAHTSNLDVPYLFWTMLGIRELCRAIGRIGRIGGAGECEASHVHARWGVGYALAAVATKDQAYATFVLVIGFAFALVLRASLKAPGGNRALGKTVLVSFAMLAFTLGILEAGFFNPSGFRARVHFLTGSASQDFVDYTADAVGRVAVIRDVILRMSFGHPALWIGPLTLVGLIATVRARMASHSRAATLALTKRAIPFLGALSFLLFFNLVARRTDHRFVMPVWVLLGVYAGHGASVLWKNVAARAFVVVGAAWALFQALTVIVNLAQDPRYDAEAWLESQVLPGETIETYGLNVYLPRLPKRAHVVRVGQDAHRNPMPGFEEVRDAFSNIEQRKPKYVVVSLGWAWRYLHDADMRQAPGRVMPPTQQASARELDGRTYFQALIHQKLNYRTVHMSAFTSRIWPRFDIHASTGREIFVLERVEPASSGAIPPQK